MQRSKFFEERAAIFEFDANRSRAEAEILAMVLTRRYCESLGIALPSDARFKALSRIDACWDD